MVKKGDTSYSTQSILFSPINSNDVCLSFFFSFLIHFVSRKMFYFLFHHKCENMIHLYNVVGKTAIN